MAVLGKRKASEPKVSQEDVAEIFRRHFEAQFEPLDLPAKKAVAESKDDEDSNSDGGEKDSVNDEESDESEWGGLSDQVSDDGDEEATSAVEVVDHSESQPPKPVAMSKHDLKAFMSSRPPDQTAPPKPQGTSQTTSSSSTLPEDAPSLLAQDLELRRLLAESHLLAPHHSTSLSGSSHTESKPFASGRIRQKATDLRVQALGSNVSILKQEKMPMNMRKGIIANTEAREAKRRREARENGIILERETGKKTRTKKRDMGIDRPGVGRLKGAELRINDADVRSIEGSRDAFGRKSGGRGGKRR